MTTFTSAVPARERAYLVRFSAETLILLAGGVLALVVAAFFLGRKAEQTHRKLWGPRASSHDPGAGRPEPLPEVRFVAPNTAPAPNKGARSR